MNRVVAPLIMLVVLLVLIASGTFYTVDETEQVIVTQFGEPARAPITTPGLKVVMYLAAAGKYLRLLCRPLEGQKGMDERTVMASQRPSGPG